MTGTDNCFGLFHDHNITMIDLCFYRVRLKTINRYYFLVHKYIVSHHYNIILHYSTHVSINSETNLPYKYNTKCL